jgi:hypothetical protein
MSEHTPSHANAPKSGAPHAARKLSCEEWEALLVDFLDGTLTPSEIEIFRAHDQTCDPCAKMFSEASQGREWLAFLRTEPAVPPALMSRILAQTAGALIDTRLDEVFHGKAAPAPSTAVGVVSGPVLPFWRRAAQATHAGRIAQPRLLMTAAMAFFSITLTLNMAGVKLSAVRLADLKPASISTNLDKQYHMASARVVRYYDSLRFVYEMEARVRELRRDADLDNSAPAEKPAQPSSSAPADGGHKSGGKSEGPSATQPHAELWGERVEAALRDPFAAQQMEDFHPAQPDFGSSAEQTQSTTAGQAERGIA